MQLPSYLGKPLPGVKVKYHLAAPLPPKMVDVYIPVQQLYRKQAFRIKAAVVKGFPGDNRWPPTYPRFAENGIKNS